MQILVDDTTRFFSVVGAPHIDERHIDDCIDDSDESLRPRAVYLANLPRPCTVGSWLQDDL
jgi:hypothetical protein